MILPVTWPDGLGMGIKSGQECSSCGKGIPEQGPCIWYSFPPDENFYLHVKCAEHVALMMMRDVAECRCGPDVANARYRQIRKIVPMP